MSDRIEMNKLLFWTVFPIVWVNLIGFPFIGIAAIFYFGAWGALYFPAAFGFMMWAGEWGQLMEYVPQRTWRDHARIVLVDGIVGGPLVCVGFFAVIWVFGMMGESYTQHSMEMARCQRQAVTPYDYHRC